MTAEDNREPPTFSFRRAGTNAVFFEWQPSADDWIRLQAFARAAGVTPEEVILMALERFLATGT